MEREEAVRIVNAAISRNYNSMSAYILHSSPWTTDEDAEALEAFQAIRAEQEQTASWLTTRLREDYGAGPTLRAFEFWDIDLNYLSVPYLVRFAHDHFKGMEGKYDALLKEAGEGDEALAAILKRLKGETGKHAKALEKVMKEEGKG